jgi:uncharacterized membrane protein (DUF485 family)
MVKANDLAKAVMPEESVVSKAEELMETLDHIKKYNALAKSLKSFGIIIATFFVMFFALRGLVDFLDLSSKVDKSVYFSVLFLLLLIPIAGIAIGILTVKKKVSARATRFHQP